jgi:hypothetical protein
MTHSLSQKGRLRHTTVTLTPYTRNVMRVDLESRAIQTMVFPGMLLGFALLLVGFFGEGKELVAVPGLALTFAGLLYGLR